MKLVIHSVLLSSDPPSAGKDDAAAAEAKAANQEMEGRGRNTESLPMIGEGRVICLADIRVNYRQVVAVKAKIEAMVKVEAEARVKAKTLERRVQLCAWSNGHLGRLTCRMLSFHLV